MTDSACTRPSEAPGPRLVVRAPDCGVDLHAVYAAEPLLERRWRDHTWVLPLVPLLPPGPVAVRLQYEARPYRAAAHLQAALRGPLAQLAAHPSRHDGTLTSLASLRPTAQHAWTGTLAPVSYFCTRALESLLDGPQGLRAADQPGPGRLPTPEDSLLACDIGVVVLLRTADDRLVAQRRSSHLDWRPGHLSVSASGSLEPGRDFSCPQVDLQGLLAGARRELAEELGVGGPLDPARDALQVESLGIWRELQRGGKPELYALARTPLCFAEVRALHRRAPDAAESAELHALDAAACRGILDDLAARGGKLDGPVDGWGPIDLALVAALLLTAERTG